MRIFLFDDDPETLESLVFYLKCEGNELVYFVSAQKAMEFARRTNDNIDVAVVDSGFDSNYIGVKIAIMLRSNNPRARIIVITGFPEAYIRDTLENYDIELYERPQDIPKLIEELGCL